MPRILHIIDSLGHSGVARQMMQVAHGLAGQGFDVHVAVLNELSSSASRLPRKDPAVAGAGLEVTRFGRRWSVDPLVEIQLARHMARLRPDIVHTWDTDGGTWGHLMLRLAEWALNRRRASNGGAGRPRFVVGSYRIKHLPTAWESWCQRRSVQLASRHVTNSSAVRDWCTARGIATAAPVMIPPGVPPALASDVSRDELLRELHLPNDARLIGVVGRLIPEKRVQELIWAADLLRVLHDNLRVLVIGDGPLRNQLEQYARMASDLDHIRFLGERDDMWRIWPHLDVLWNGSDNGSVSIAMLEAMAAGVPVVASDVPVNREVVVHGETGYLVPIGVRSGRADRARHTDRLFANVDLARRLGAAARERVVERFAAEQVIRSHVEQYNQIET